MNSLTNRKDNMKNKPTWENTDKLRYGRHKEEQNKRKRARELAAKLMGKNYFTNMQEVMLQSAIELSERKDNV